jgi:hypothetical protein
LGEFNDWSLDRSCWHLLMIWACEGTAFLGSLFGFGVFLAVNAIAKHGWLHSIFMV